VSLMPQMRGHSQLVSRGIVHIVGAEAFTAMVPEATAVVMHHA
jgi:hypothetical protein